MTQQQLFHDSTAIVTQEQVFPDSTTIIPGLNSVSTFTGISYVLNQMPKGRIMNPDQWTQNISEWSLIF